MANLNPKLQRQIIGKKLKSIGVDADLIDLEAHIDSKLTLAENYRIIKADAKYLAPVKKVRSNPFGTSSGNKINNLAKAHDIHDARPFTSRIADRAFNARTIFEPSELNNKNFKRWANSPNRFDIFGVDSKIKKRKK